MFKRQCVVKYVDTLGIEHAAKVEAESLFEAAVRGLHRLDSSCWTEEDVWDRMCITVEVYEEPPTVTGAASPRTSEEGRIEEALFGSRWISDAPRLSQNCRKRETLLIGERLELPARVRLFDEHLCIQGFENVF